MSSNASYLLLACFSTRTLFCVDFGSCTVEHLRRWCDNDAVRKKLADPTSHLRSVRHPLAVNQLVSLPKDFSELINRVSSFTYAPNIKEIVVSVSSPSMWLGMETLMLSGFCRCPRSDGDDCRAPTMCLICGKMLCSQSYCCQTELQGKTVGSATAHAHHCGAGTGIFLR